MPDPASAPAPAPTPDPTPAPAPSPAPSPAPAPAPSFHESIQDEGLRSWVQTKGLKDAESAVKTAFNLEKLVGAPADEVLRLPKAGDADGRKALFTKLGMPESADKYEFSVPDGMPVDENFQKWAKESFHKANLTGDQAKVVNEAWNEYIQAQTTAHNEAAALDATNGTNQLKTEWGNGFERQMNIASNAARQLGFEADTLNAMQSAMGYAATIKFMATLGAKLGEDNFVQGENSQQGFHSQMTPDQAKAAYNKLLTDEGFNKALTNNQHPGHKDALARKEALFKLMYPEK